MKLALLKNPFRFFINKHKKTFGLGLMALVLTNVFDILNPFLIGKVIDLIADQKFSSSFTYYIALLFLAALGTAVFRFYWRIFFGRFHQQVAADLRNILFKKLMRLNLNYHNKVATGEKMTLLTQDVENFRMGIGPGILILCDSMIYIISLLPLMIMVSPSWTWKCLIFMPLIPFVIYRMESSFMKLYRNLQNQTGELTSFAQESVSGIKVIKSLSLQEVRSQFFKPLNTKLKDFGLKVDRNEAAFGPSLEIFVMLGTATLLFVGSKDVINGQVSVGDFFAFYQYLLRMVWPMTAIGLSFMMYKEADSSFDRIKEALISEQEVPLGYNEVQKGGDLKLKDLNYSFSPKTTKALSEISFDLKNNQSLAIVGPVGSGKSILSQVLARSLCNFSGKVDYNQRPILEIHKDHYRKIISLVPQDVFLFKESIRKNLTNFSPQPASLSDEQLYKILKEVQLDQEIKNMQFGLDTVLLEKGQGLSGGQRQRLTLARGLLQESQWLILDDSLSAVDVETEQKIMNYLYQLKAQKKMNFIICSHRIQNIKWVDKILVLKQGRIQSAGSHEDLIQSCELYRSLYASNKESEAVSDTPIGETSHES